MNLFDYQDGFLVAMARSESALNELLQENKNVLYCYNGEYYFKPADYKITNLTQTGIAILEELNEFDVIEFYDDNNFRVLYSASSNDNALFVTNKCNSNCVMCPCSENFRQKEPLETIDHLCKVAEYIPSDVRFLTITGGEPTLLHNNMERFLLTLRNHFEGTKFFLLTNGRTFSDDTFFQLFIDSMPENLRFAIPIYGFDSETHDSITQAPNSFNQTVRGIKKLLANNCEIEIRIVVSKLNYRFMDKVADFIAKEFRGIHCVHIMATEMMGSAARNRENVWIDYSEAFKYSKKAIKTLISNGIDVELYNFPLCKVDRGYWSLCARSITDYKVRYGEFCDECCVKSICGGVFRSTLLLTKMPLNPIKELE